MLEQKIIYFCAPTLAGIKTGSLFNAGKMSAAEIRRQAAGLMPAMIERGVALRLFERAKKPALIYVYRRSALQRDLNRPAVRSLLASRGYDLSSADAALDTLEDRLAQSPVFPHEIGVFLGYPPEDVAAFITLGSSQCQLCGYWCAYANPVAAQACFDRFDRCHRCYRQRFQLGQRLAALTVAG